MIDNTQSEEFWIHHVVKDFDYIVCNDKLDFDKRFYSLLSVEAKHKLYLLISNEIYDGTVNDAGY